MLLNIKRISHHPCVELLVRGWYELYLTASIPDHSILFNADSSAVICYEDDKIVGVLSYHIWDSCFFVELVYVVPESRSKGIATIMQKFLLDIAKKEDIRNIIGNIHSSNISAIKSAENSGRKEMYKTFITIVEDL